MPRLFYWLNRNKIFPLFHEEKYSVRSYQLLINKETLFATHILQMSNFRLVLVSFLSPYSDCEKLKK